MPDEVSVFNGYTNGLAVDRKGNEGQMEDLLNFVQLSPSHYVPISLLRFDMSTRSLSLYQKFKMAAEFKNVNGENVKNYKFKKKNFFLLKILCVTFFF
jgi:hypothetical protein